MNRRWNMVLDHLHNRIPVHFSQQRIRTTLTPKDNDKTATNKTTTRRRRLKPYCTCTLHFYFGVFVLLPIIQSDYYIKFIFDLHLLFCDFKLDRIFGLHFSFFLPFRFNLDCYFKRDGVIWTLAFY